MRIAFIVQRYGAEILGGSEYHCRLIAERLGGRHQVEVLTTCARDYITWENAYPEGIACIGDVTVRRFATSQIRDLASFHTYSDWIFYHPHSYQDEMEWLKQQGPWSPSLLEFLEGHHQSYDVLIFFTYLYAPTVMGIRIAPAKSLLVPTAHDELALGLGIYEELFSSAAGIVWNTEAERKLVNTRFQLRPLAQDVVGCGVDVPEADARLNDHARAHAFRQAHGVHGAFVLYGGRIEPGKGCEELLEYFQAYVSECGGDARLIFMGEKMMPLPDDPRVQFVGLLSEQERLDALEDATVVAVPSPHESLSLLALEAFAMGTPVLANAQAAVLVEHCVRSNAGLYYAEREEFVLALNLLLRDARLRAAMGRNGRAYVNQHYRWSSILAKYETLMARVLYPGR
ncbi:MAG TPA: glycosyltransferase family 4 protein [Vicinamibacterales bacterium]|nr:glycosyltransferase family 4 protein [Vicinamibacterales bacterium]